VLGRLLWNPDADVEWIFTDFLEKGFGRSAPQMRKYFTLWRCAYASWKLESASRTLEQALKDAESPGTRFRIEQYTQYVDYLRLLSAYQNASHDKERKLAQLALIEAAAKIMPTNMAHTGPLIGRFLNPSSAWR
jgi:hypothetical protein